MNDTNLYKKKAPWSKIDADLFLDIEIYVTYFKTSAADVRNGSSGTEI